MLSLAEMRRAAALLDVRIRGHRLQAVAQPAADSLVLTLYGGASSAESGRRQHLRLSCRPGSARVSVCGRVPRGLPAPGPFVQFLRAHGVGARVSDVRLVGGDRQLALGLGTADGELELLLTDAANKDELMKSLAADVAGKEKKVRCPICAKQLDKVHCGVDKKIRLDKCPKNDGLWFDRGELLEVINMGEFPVDDRVYSLLHQIFGDKSQV